MKYSDLAWAALCFFYRSCGDLRYVEIMSDEHFIHRLKNEPSDISCKEFEEKAILGYIKIENYDLLMKHKLAMALLEKVTELMPFVFRIQDLDILTADLSESGSDSVSRASDHIYNTLNSVNGIWSTGASKIMHLLNDRLYPVVTTPITEMLRLPHTKFSMAEYMKRIQYQAATACQDFKKIPGECTADDYLSTKLGYSAKGCRKSLVKFIDEYYVLVTRGLPVPPPWTPVADTGCERYILSESFN